MADQYAAVNYVHNLIVGRAAEIANVDPDKHPQFNFHPLAVASEATQSGIDGLCLEWDRERGLQRFSPDEQIGIVNQMHSVAQRAVRQAILENREQFVGLILGEARLGRNYFEHFNDNATHTPRDS